MIYNFYIDNFNTYDFSFELHENNLIFIMFLRIIINFSIHILSHIISYYFQNKHISISNMYITHVLFSCIIDSKVYKAYYTIILDRLIQFFFKLM